MGRRKVRHYKTREHYKELFDKYFRENNDKVMLEVLNEMGFNTIEELRNAEYRGYTGLDCGWIVLSPRNAEQRHEWFLDDYRISADMFVSNPCYNTQSTTIKEIMVRRALKDLELENDFSVGIRLD